MTRSARGTVEQPGAGVRQKAGLNRAILDQGWGDFVRRLEEKIEEVGGTLLRVDPYGTSQQCPGCGLPAPKPFHQRVHRCQGCGLIEDRDVAAAQVVANRAAHLLNGSGESRVEDAPAGAPKKPNPVVLRAGRERWESSLVGRVSLHPSLRRGAAQQSEKSLVLAERSSNDAAAQHPDRPLGVATAAEPLPSTSAAHDQRVGAIDRS
jgi:hypothetical protein